MNDDELICDIVGRPSEEQAAALARRLERARTHGAQARARGLAGYRRSRRPRPLSARRPGVGWHPPHAAVGSPTPRPRPRLRRAGWSLPPPGRPRAADRTHPARVADDTIDIEGRNVPPPTASSSTSTARSRSRPPRRPSRRPLLHGPSTSALAAPRPTATPQPRHWSVAPSGVGPWPPPCHPWRPPRRRRPRPDPSPAAQRHARRREPPAPGSHRHAGGLLEQSEIVGAFARGQLVSTTGDAVPGPTTWPSPWSPAS